MPSRAGTIPAAVSEAFDGGLFRLPPVSELRTSAVGATWKIPVILVDFTDQPLTYSSPQEWNSALFDTTSSTPTGSVFDYYRWVSGQRIRVVGRVVATVHLDYAKSYYANNSWGLSNSTPHNSYGVVDHALRKCSAEVDWSEFDQDRDGYVDMLWVVHSGIGGEHTVTRQDLWSITSRLTQWSGGLAYQTEDKVPGTSVYERIDAFSILPELSAFRRGARSEIGVFCHEFGHALGLPDLYDTAPLTGTFNVGPGNWSLMSTGAYGGDGASPEYPSHLGAWPMTFLGWGRPVRPTEDTPMALAPLERGGSILELWFQGEAHHEHFLAEYRRREGFDRNLPADGLIVYQVDDLVIRAGLPSNRVNYGLYPALRLIEGDGGRDLVEGTSRGDAGDPLPGTAGLTRWADDTWPNSRSIRGNVTHVALLDIHPATDSLRCHVRVRPAGWLPARDQSGTSFFPVLGSGLGARAALLEDSSVVAVTGQLLNGRSQIVFRHRRPDQAWDTPLQISSSSGAATEPSVASLPGGDVCVAWSDTRNGANELYFRSRIRGVWTPEQRLTQLPGYSRSPSLGADRRGGIHLTWLYNDEGGLWVYFMYFTYVSPFGDPIPVTASGNRADPPALAVAPDQSSYLLWHDRSTTPTSLWYTRYVPGSGLGMPERLATPVSGTQSTLGAIVDSAGVLHYVWHATGVDGTEIRYQRLGAWTSDTTIVRTGESIQDLMLAMSLDGGVHLVMEATSASGTQILYKEYRQDGGWDVGSTEVTGSTDGVAARPTVLPRRAGTVTVLYTGYQDGAPAFMERDRSLWRQPLTAVPPSQSSALASWHILPNPLRAGRALRLRREGPPLGARRLEIFDLAGRIVATAEVHAAAAGWIAEIPGNDTRRWASGVYFARLSGENVPARIVVLR